MSIQKRIFVLKSRILNLEKLESSAAGKRYYETALEFKREREKTETELKSLTDALSRPTLHKGTYGQTRLGKLAFA